MSDKDKLENIKELTEKYVKPAAQELSEQMVNAMVGLFGKPEDIKKHKFDLDPRLTDDTTKQD